MKKIIILLAIILLATSCETESLVIKNSAQDNLSENTVLIQKLKRLSQFPTTSDNIVDRSSCFALRLPVTVTANNQVVIINSVADYQEVRNIFDQNTGDTDTILLQFPVTIIFTDYSELVLETPDAFEAATANCIASIELSCIDFIYPMQIKSYNSGRQLAETFSLGSKKALFQFLDHAQMYDAVSLTFPLDFIAPDGIILRIENNNELEDSIDRSTDDCLAAFNNEPTNPGTDTVEEVLTQGNWYVSYFFRETNQTSDYATYDFTFNTNGTASVTGGSSAITGSWASILENSEKKIAFAFSSSSLEELEESWVVTEFTATLIKMRYESGGSGTRYLHLTRN